MFMVLAPLNTTANADRVIAKVITKKIKGKKISIQDAHLQPLLIVKDMNRPSNIINSQNGACSTSTCPVDSVAFQELQELCSNIYTNSQNGTQATASEQFAQNKEQVSQEEDGSLLMTLQPVQQIPCDTGTITEVCLENDGQNEDGREAQQVHRDMDETGPMNIPLMEHVYECLSELPSEMEYYSDNSNTLSARRRAMPPSSEGTMWTEGQASWNSKMNK